MTLLLVSVIGALTISALCSILEATLLSFSSSQVEAMAGRRPKIAAVWRDFKQNIERPIAVILIMNTAAHTIGATLAGAKFEETFGPQWLIAFSILFTYLMLQFTEILPKSLGVRYNRQLAPWIVAPLTLLVRVLYPVLWFVHLINRPFERTVETTDSTLQEITALASMARLSQRIDPQQERMIHTAARFDDLRVRQIMTPRTEVVFLKVQDEVQAILDTVQDGSFTRFPLCDRDVDHVIGLVHIKDLFRHLDLVPGRFDITPLAPAHDAPERVLAIPGSGLHVIGSGTLDLRKISREIFFVPENAGVLTLLRQFQESRQHFAVVVDEYGATAGIVTLEDIIEEMIGDIEDEFDTPSTPLWSQVGDAYRISARMTMYDFHKLFPALESDDEGVDTVGGWVAKIFGSLPAQGESLTVGNYTVTVIDADQKCVHEIQLLEHPSDPESG